MIDISNRTNDLGSTNLLESIELVVLEMDSERHNPPRKEVVQSVRDGRSDVGRVGAGERGGGAANGGRVPGLPDPGGAGAAGRGVRGGAHHAGRGAVEAGGRAEGRAAPVR